MLWMYKFLEVPSVHHHHYHHGCIASESHQVIALCPWPTAHLQRSHIGWSESSWSCHLFHGRPGGRCDVWSGGQLRDVLTCS